MRLKPIVYTTSTFKSGAPNKIQQMLLLKALQVTSDPKELRRMIGVKTVADVYRTLDKLAMRKEYHKALESMGVSFEYIVRNIRKVVDSEDAKDGDKLKAIQMLLKSVGMDKYEGEADSSRGTWEEALIKASDDKKNQVVLDGDYEVVHPELPAHIRAMQEEEQRVSKSLYED